MDPGLANRTAIAVRRFCDWLDRYGETSYDHQSFYASPLGRRAKAFYYSLPRLGTAAVAPMVCCEAILPSARRLFWKRQRFPIADAHYAMGFALLAEFYEENKYYRRAVHFLQALEDTRCTGRRDYCWGYPFDWQTRFGVIQKNTPLITAVPYAYEAYSSVYKRDGDKKWLKVMRSIAEHVSRDYRDRQTSPQAATCAYTPSPNDLGGVINASAYRAFLMIQAARDLSEPQYEEIGRKNLNFVLETQNADGSWYYSTDGRRDFIDHFHTCFVLKALAKLERLGGYSVCGPAIEKGVRYYLRNLFDAEGLPVPFSKPPRLTVYQRELYDYAECINLAVLLDGRFHQLDHTLSRVLSDLLDRWQKSDGSFRSRKLWVGWDNVPMHRWAQAQLFRSLCGVLRQHVLGDQDSVSLSSLQDVEPRP